MIPISPQLAAVARYGEVAAGKWPEESKWCTLFMIPEAITPTWINSQSNRPTVAIYCNKDIIFPLTQALESVINRGLVSLLKTYDGCYCIRNIRGTQDDLSAHSYAIAIDINARWNPLGQPSTQDPRLIQCFKDAGFFWGGDFEDRIDAMHFSLARW